MDKGWVIKDSETKIAAIEKEIQDHEWSVEYHSKKLKGAELMLDVYRDMLKTLKKKKNVNKKEEV